MPAIALVIAAFLIVRAITGTRVPAAGFHDIACEETTAIRALLEWVDFAKKSDARRTFVFLSPTALAAAVPIEAHVRSVRLHVQVLGKW